MKRMNFPLRRSKRREQAIARNKLTPYTRTRAYRRAKEAS